MTGTRPGHGARQPEPWSSPEWTPDGLSQAFFVFARWSSEKSRQLCMWGIVIIHRVAHQDASPHNYCPPWNPSFIA